MVQTPEKMCIGRFVLTSQTGISPKIVFLHAEVCRIDDRANYTADTDGQLVKFVKPWSYTVMVVNVAGSNRVLPAHRSNVIGN